ncbi:DUF6241 domain-containing protein [Thalassobacillus hwangdonensis]|uniref:DUF6241 domain-containing protein n=1 Tax=Thalassobacillus hwangdonensis TaxID=546108 RepID=A0ABW3L4Z6_9BACI
MWKTILFSLIGAIILLVGSFFAFQEFLFQTDDVETSKAEEESGEASDITVEELREEAGGQASEEEMARYEEQGKNPFGQEKQASELGDTGYQEYIHGMSHQKVEAPKKWGFYEINDTRIDWLLKGLDEAELEHEQTYRRILEKWKAGDFSTADQDHNAIWSLQGGTIGKATGVLSPSEEAAYLKSKQ